MGRYNPLTHRKDFRVPELKTEIQQRPEGLVMSILGEVNIVEVDALTRQFLALLDRKPKLVVLDLSRLGFIASAGMGAMIAFRRDLGKVGGEVRLAAIKPQVREALRRALFERIFQMYETVDAALSAT
jgi:anti-sigma B factor antagonist